MVIVLLTASLAAAAPALARNSARLQAGVDFFSSFLAADTKITDKTSRDGHLVLAIVAGTESVQIKKLIRRLEAIGKIRRLPLRVVLTTDSDLKQFKSSPPAGVFIAEPNLGHLDILLDWGRENQRIVFSPFTGDVPRGVFGGVSVREMVLPLVNQRALDDWGIVLKPFFLRIAERYDEN